LARQAKYLTPRFFHIKSGGRWGAALASSTHGSD